MEFRIRDRRIQTITSSTLTAATGAKTSTSGTALRAAPDVVLHLVSIVNLSELRDN